MNENRGTDPPAEVKKNMLPIFILVTYCSRRDYNSLTSIDFHIGHIKIHSGRPKWDDCFIDMKRRFCTDKVGIMVW